MALTCNIEAKGRLIRGLAGLVLIAVALALVFLLPPTGWRRFFVVILALGAIFCIFQAAAGWCAVRAMGIKTRF